MWWAVKLTAMLYDLRIASDFFSLGFFLVTYFHSNKIPYANGCRCVRLYRIYSFLAVSTFFSGFGALGCSCGPEYGSPWNRPGREYRLGHLGGICENARGTEWQHTGRSSASGSSSLFVVWRIGPFGNTAFFFHIVRK